MKPSCQLPKEVDLVINHVQVLPCNDPELEQPIDDGAVLVHKGEILWVGNTTDAPKVRASESINGNHKWLLPGFVDCHSHLVFAGQRANEFEQRLKGVSYQQIAAQGGGILASVEQTCAASESQLLRDAIRRATALLRQGVTTIEIKSGYGLNLEDEVKMLRVARQLAQLLPINVFTTFLGAHTLPQSYRDRPQAYVDDICHNMLPHIAELGLADAVDVFCESIGFNLAHTEQIFKTAQQLGLPVKLHAEQLSNMGGSALAARYGALSVDHIEYLDEAGIAAIAQSGTVATLLPGAFYFLKESQKPPVELLRQYQVPMALATDFNPGTSPLCHLPLMMNMACTFFGLTVHEALLGVTRHGAKALGSNTLGQIAAGMQADLTLWDIERPAQLVYEIGSIAPQRIWHKGRQVSLNNG